MVLTNLFTKIVCFFLKTKSFAKKIILIAQINVFLAVFNMIPIPPFDGSRILFAVLPDKYYFKVMQYERILMFAMLLIIATDVLNRPLNLASGLILNLINTVASLPFMFF